MQNDGCTVASPADELAALQRRVAELETALEQERINGLRQTPEEMARACRLKDDLLAAMSHDLRTPLHTILIHAEALEEGLYGPVTSKQMESLGRVHECGRQLRDAINDLLELNLIMAGKPDTRFDLAQVELACQVSLRLIRPLAQKKQLHISFALDKAVSILHINEQQLKQILIILLDDAVKFSPAGGALGLEVLGDAKNKAAHLSVWDTGRGLSPQDIEQLFQPCAPLKGNPPQPAEGARLGLALIKRLVEAYRGRLGVTSQTGQGNRFTVTLPWQV